MISDLRLFGARITTLCAVDNDPAVRCSLRSQKRKDENPAGLCLQRGTHSTSDRIGRKIDPHFFLGRSWPIGLTC